MVICKKTLNLFSFQRNFFLDFNNKFLNYFFDKVKTWPFVAAKNMFFSFSFSNFILYLQAVIKNRSHRVAFTSSFWMQFVFNSVLTKTAFKQNDVVNAKSKVNFYNLVFMQKCKFELVFRFKFLKLVLFNTNMNLLVSFLDNSDVIESTFLKKITGKYSKKLQPAGRSFRDFQVRVKFRLYDILKMHKRKKKSVILNNLFSVNYAFFKAKEARLPSGIRGVIPYKYLRRRKPSTYIFWHIEKFYFRVLSKLTKYMKIKRIDSTVFNFVRKVNMFKARKLSKQGKRLKKYKFLLKIKKKLTNRFFISAKYRQTVKLFYLKKNKIIRQTFQQKLKQSNKDVFSFLLERCKQGMKEIIIRILFMSFLRVRLFNSSILKMFRFKYQIKSKPIKFKRKFFKFFTFKKLRLFVCKNSKVFYLTQTQMCHRLLAFCQRFLFLFLEKKKRYSFSFNFFKQFFKKKALKKLKIRLKKVLSFIKKTRFNFVLPLLKFVKRDLGSVFLNKQGLQFNKKIKRNTLVKKMLVPFFNTIVLNSRNRFFNYTLLNSKIREKRKARLKKIKTAKVYNLIYEKNRSNPYLTEFVLVKNNKKYGKKKRKNKRSSLFFQLTNKIPDFVSKQTTLHKRLGCFLPLKLFSNFACFVFGHKTKISSDLLRVFYPKYDIYPQFLYKKIEMQPGDVFIENTQKLVQNTHKFFGCFKSFRMVQDISRMFSSFRISFLQLKIFNFLELGFLSLLNFNHLNSKLNDRFSFYIENLIYFKQYLANETLKLRWYKQVWEQQNNPEFFKPQLSNTETKSGFYFTPGFIIFTLNSNTIFLTVLNNAGYTVFQTSTGVVNKKRIKNKKVKKTIIRGFKARRDLYRRVLQKQFKKISKIRSKVQRRAKRKSLFQIIKRKKGRKRKKLPKGKSFFVTSDFVRNLILILTPLLKFLQNENSYKAFFKNQIVRKKLQMKLDKIKTSKKFDPKAFHLLIKKLKSLNLKKKNKKYFKRKRTYSYITSKNGHLYVQRRMKALFNSKIERMKKIKVKSLLKKKINKPLNLNFKKKIINFWLSSKKRHKNELSFNLKHLGMFSFVKNINLFKNKVNMLFKKKSKVIGSFSKQGKYKMGGSKSFVRYINRFLKCGGMAYSLLTQNYKAELLDNLVKSKVNADLFKLRKNKVFLQEKNFKKKIKKNKQIFLFIKALALKRLVRYFLLFKNIDGQVVRRAFKFWLTKFFNKIFYDRLLFDKKFTKKCISSYFYQIVNQNTQVAFNSFGMSILNKK